MCIYTKNMEYVGVGIICQVSTVVISDSGDGNLETQLHTVTRSSLRNSHNLLETLTRVKPDPWL